MFCRMWHVISDKPSVELHNQEQVKVYITNKKTRNTRVFLFWHIKCFIYDKSHLKCACKCTKKQGGYEDGTSDDREDKESRKYIPHG